MEAIELVELLKVPAIESSCMTNNFVLPSLLISHSIYCLNNGITTENAIVNKHSLFNKKKSYKSYESCISSFQNSVKIDVHTGFYTIDQFIEFLYSENTEDIKKEYDNIMDQYKLDEFDNEVYKQIHKDTTEINIAEEKKEPFVDIYVVRKTYNSTESELLKTQDKKEAIKVCKNKLGYSVYDSKGREVYSNTMPASKVKQTLDVIEAGLDLNLLSVNLYSSATDKSPVRSISGLYYIYNGKETNGRYAICKSKDFVNKGQEYIVGYINKSSIQ